MKKFILFFLITVLLILPLHANANIIDTVTLIEGYNPDDSGTFHFPVLGTNSVYDNYNAAISGGTVIQDGIYEAFCVENAWTSGDNNLYTVLGIDSGLGKFGLTADSYFKAAWIAEEYYDVDKEAAQIAIWEIMFDTTYDIANDSFYVVSGISSDTLDNANSYLSSVSGITFADDFSSNWVLAVNPVVSEGGTVCLASSQNYIFRASPVPEPATMLLLGTGLIGLTGIGRKKFKKN